MSAKSDKNRLISTAEAAAELGLTERRIRAMITAGILPAEKVGKSHIIRFADLDAARDRKPGRPVGYRAPKKPKSDGE